MTQILETRLSKPIEREFEAWIINGIDSYFDAISTPVSIWAVSPSHEASWPADEQVWSQGKLIGLQFKQAKLTSAGGLKFPDYSRLKWQFHQPKGQFALVKANKEIFYCLPTFVNRDWRTRALDHCIFWRPGTANDMNAWYENPQAKTPYKSIGNASRWGYFIEKLFACQIGVRIASEAEFDSYIRHLHGSLRDDIPRLPEDVDVEPEPPGLYLLYIHM